MEQHFNRDDGLLDETRPVDMQEVKVDLPNKAAPKLSVQRQLELQWIPGDVYKMHVTEYNSMMRKRGAPRELLFRVVDNGVLTNKLVTTGFVVINNKMPTLVQDVFDFPRPFWTRVLGKEFEIPEVMQKRKK